MGPVLVQKYTQNTRDGGTNGVGASAELCTKHQGKIPRKRAGVRAELYIRLCLQVYLIDSFW